jgi:hypothetical protein
MENFIYLHKSSRKSLETQNPPQQQQTEHESCVGNNGGEISTKFYNFQNKIFPQCVRCKTCRGWLHEAYEDSFECNLLVGKNFLKIFS